MDRSGGVLRRIRPLRATPYDRPVPVTPNPSSASAPVPLPAQNGLLSQSMLDSLKAIPSTYLGKLETGMIVELESPVDLFGRCSSPGRILRFLQASIPGGRYEFLKGARFPSRTRYIVARGFRHVPTMTLRCSGHQQGNGNYLVTIETNPGPSKTKVRTKGSHGAAGRAILNKALRYSDPSEKTNFNPKSDPKGKGKDKPQNKNAKVTVPEGYCQDYFDGSCKYGSKCRLTHDSRAGKKKKKVNTEEVQETITTTTVTKENTTGPVIPPFKPKTGQQTNGKHAVGTMDLAKVTRGNKNSKLIARSIIDSQSDLRGAFDALNEKKRELTELEKDAIDASKGKDEARDETGKPEKYVDTKLPEIFKKNEDCYAGFISQSECRSHIWSNFKRSLISWTIQAATEAVDVVVRDAQEAANSLSRLSNEIGYACRHSNGSVKRAAQVMVNTYHEAVYATDRSFAEIWGNDNYVPPEVLPPFALETALQELNIQPNEIPALHGYIRTDDESLLDDRFVNYINAQPNQPAQDLADTLLRAIGANQSADPLELAQFPDIFQGYLTTLDDFSLFSVDYAERESWFRTRKIYRHLRDAPLDTFANQINASVDIVGLAVKSCAHSTGRFFKKIFTATQKVEWQAVAVACLRPSLYINSFKLYKSICGFPLILLWQGVKSCCNLAPILVDYAFCYFTVQDGNLRFVVENIAESPTDFRPLSHRMYCPKNSDVRVEARFYLQTRHKELFSSPTAIATYSTRNWAFVDELKINTELCTFDYWGARLKTVILNANVLMNLNDPKMIYSDKSPADRKRMYVANTAGNTSLEAGLFERIKTGYDSISHSFDLVHDIALGRHSTVSLMNCRDAPVLK